MNIYIPTRGRVNKQTTFNSLPAPYQTKTKLVVDAKEEAEYRETYGKEHVMVLPKTCKGIAYIRQHIMENADDNHIIMLDDDLRFNYKTPEGRILTSPLGKVTPGFKLIEKWLHSGLVHCGLIPRFLWWSKPYSEMYRENSRMMHFLGYNVDAVLEAGCDFTKNVTRKFSMDDFYMTLQLITKGHKNRVSLRYFTNPSVSNSAGGASEWRTIDSHNYSANKLGKMFPDCVTVKEKHGWKGMEGSRFDVVINWRRAAAMGGLS